LITGVAQRIETMAAPVSDLFFNPQSAIRNPQLCRGFSLLDLLVTLLVLALILLAAVYQFSNYQKSEVPPAPPAQSAPAQQ
jgi:prepilin-type N-terminal cleavage/methylation domain-containing protein